METQSPNTILDRLLGVNADESLPVSEFVCPDCGKPGLKAGRRGTRVGKVQRLYCRPCETHFSASPLPRRQYSPSTILETMTAYNLGRTIADTKNHIARRFRTTVPQSTIHSWLAQFASVCTFSRFRKRYSFSEEEVQHHRLGGSKRACRQQYCQPYSWMVFPRRRSHSSRRAWVLRRQLRWSESLK
jgi:hypothetical protein